MTMMLRMIFNIKIENKMIQMMKTKFNKKYKKSNLMKKKRKLWFKKQIKTKVTLFH